MKADFYRKCASASELEIMKKNESENLFLFHDSMEFKVEEIFKFMEVEEYEEFTNNFLTDRDVIARIKDKLFIDDSGVCHCALFTCNNEVGYLVYPSGFSYPRYVAKWNVKMGYGGDKK